MKAEIWAGAYFLATGFNPGVAVLSFHDVVGNEFLVLFDHWIVHPAANQALDCKERVFRVGHRLALCRHADHGFIVFAKCDDRRRRARAFGILNYFW